MLLASKGAANLPFNSMDSEEASSQFCRLLLRRTSFVVELGPSGTDIPSCHAGSWPPQMILNQRGWRDEHGITQDASLRASCTLDL